MEGRAPTFVIPGASKSGTTSLHYYLDEHPDIYMSSPKELHFFSRNKNYEQGLEAYERNFSGWEDETAVGEASPTYFYHGRTWENKTGGFIWAPDDDPAIRLADAYPDVKILFSLRNPITRGYSQFWKNVRQGKERTVPFREALKEELRGDRTPEERPRCWVYANQYSTHLQHWLDQFGRDQVKFLVFEKWIDNTEETLNEVCEFLGVEPLEEWPHASEIKNPSKTPRSLRLNYFYHDYLKRTGIGELIYYLNLRRGYPDMSEETREFVIDLFEDEIRDTEDVIDQDLSLWLEEFR